MNMYLKSLRKCLIGTSFYQILRLSIYKWEKKKIDVQALKLKLIWRDLNRHNFTEVGDNQSNFPVEKVTVGKFTYGKLKVIQFGNDNEKLVIGNFCSIANDVKFLLGGEHKHNMISTYPFVRIFLDENDTTSFYSKGQIKVEDDVWLGSNVLILSGITISKGTVIAAGSVVTKSTEPYSIIGGNPAKLIKKRFSDEIINELLKIDFSNFNSDYIRLNIEKFSTSMDIELVNLFIQEGTQKK